MDLRVPLLRTLNVATWQLDLHLIPEHKLLAACTELPERIAVNELLATDWWEGVPPPEDYEEFFDAFMARRSTWTSAILGWGVEDSNRIDVSASKDGVEGIHVRVDARALDFAFLEYLVRFAERNGCVFVTEEGEVVCASIADVVREVESSSAHRFVVDPKTFLRALGENDEIA